ncbi:MAG TPA: DinB family protein [Blastocatellia bacterium]|nr:DinB family protein [Blastocatellia bacterium]
MDVSVLRKNLVELLQGDQAHVSLEKALDSVKPESRNARPVEGLHSVWEEFEHMRIAQEDILHYTLDAGWKSPEWPEGYWPAKTAEVTDRMWQESMSEFFADLQELIDVVQDTNLDLTTQIPHGEGRTYLRQILLVADHNAYHLGQIVQIRKALGDWPS